MTSKKGLSISKEEAKKVGSKIIPEKSIILSCVGELGLVAIAGTEMVINQQLHAFIPKSIEHRFLLYCLGNQKKYMEKIATKTAVPYMNKDNCNSIPITFPSLKEQQKIASFLSLIDERIVTQNKIIGELGVLKTTLAKKIFSQQLRFKDGLESEFPEWEDKKLQDICTIIGGGTPETNKIEYWNGDIQWFTPTEIKSNFVSKSERTISISGLKNSSAKLLPKGTILLTTRATIGEVAIALEECATNQGFQSLVVKKNNNNVFIFNWLKVNKFELEKRANGSTFPEISKSEIEKIEIVIPSLEEQTQIANFLSSIDTKLQTEKQILDQLEKQKKYLLQQMFI